MSFPQKLKELVISRTHFFLYAELFLYLVTMSVHHKKRMVKKNLRNTDEENGVGGYTSPNYG